MSDERPLFCDGCGQPVASEAESYHTFLGGGTCHDRCLELRNAKLQDITATVRRMADLEAAMRWYIVHVKCMGGRDFLGTVFSDHILENDKKHAEILRPFRKGQH